MAISDGAARTDLVSAATQAKASPMSLSDPQRYSVSAAAGIAIAALLLLGWVSALPGSPNYPDVVMYLDAAQRIGAGQTPHVDFFLPFGALSAYLFSLVKSVFPHVQPVLGAQYAVLLIALPAMLAATWRAKAKAEIAWLWAGFALFALLPANFLIFPEPFLPAGVDGRGIAEREAGLLLYVLASLLIFGEDRILAGVLSGLIFVTLGFIKISALWICGPFIVLGLFAARIDWRALIIVLALGFASVLALEWSTKLVSAYIDDLKVFAFSTNEGAHFWNDVAAVFMRNFVGAVLLGAAGIALAWKTWATPEKSDERVWLVNGGIGLLIALGASLFGERHSAGTQTLAFLAPVALKIAADHWNGRDAGRVASLCAAIFLGLIVGAALDRGVRLAASAADAEPVGAAGLGLSASVADAAAAQAWLDLQTKSAWTEREALLFGEIDRLDSIRPISAPAYALAADQMVANLESWQGAAGLPHLRIATLDLVDPGPALLELEPIAGLPVLYDPTRLDFTTRSAAMTEALGQADAILAPLCGPRSASVDYAKLVAGALVGRSRKRLSACWVMFGRPAASSPSKRH